LSRSVNYVKENLRRANIPLNGTLHECRPGTTDAPSGVYGLVPLSVSYTGPVFQARNSISLATQDFFAHTDGTFRTSPDSSGEPIGLWLGGATAYCSIWYDQSGSGNHATQTDPALQPAIDYVNYAMDFTAQGGSSYFNLRSGTVPQEKAYTVTVKHGVINNPIGGWLGGGNGATNQANGFRRDSATYVNFWWGNDIVAGSYAAGNTVTFKYDGSSMAYLYTNGDFTKSKEKDSGWKGVAGNEFLGRSTYLIPGDNPTSLNGKLYFIYIFKTALPDYARRSIEAGAYGNRNCARF
jgi:hypothetical protein